MNELVLKTHTHIAFRVKHCEEIELEKTLTYLKKHYIYILVSLETSGGLHIHGQVSVNIPPSVSTPKSEVDKLRQHLKIIYPDAKGNKCLYTQIVRVEKQSMKYILKEGNYCSTGYSKKWVDTLYKCSTKKENLKKKIDKNEEDLISRKITFEQFAIRYLEIKVNHGQNIYNNHITSYFRRLQLKTGHISYHDYYYDHFVSNL